MNVACSACPAKYVIPDEKVKGRKIRIPCKHCGAAIIVDGTASGGGAVSTSSKAPSAMAGSPSIQPREASVAPARAHPTPSTTSPSPVQPREPAIVSEAPARPTASVPSAQSREVSAPAAAPMDTAAATSPPKPAINIPQPAPVNPKPAVRPASRNIRQTIIGVAAPANAPQSPGPARRPTPIYVRAAGAEPAEVSTPGGQTGPASPHVSGQVRSMRRTMLGGLDAEPPSPEAASSEASAPMRPQKRNVKQTIIGGLEAPLGSAPGAVTSPPKRARPTQDTPPGTWLAALPDGKTLKVAERDLPRAIKKAYISMGTPLWRTGMSDWVPLNQIPELLSLLNKSATLPQAPGQDSAEPANEPKRPQLPFSAQPLAPPNAPTQRAPSASSAKQAAIPRISGAPGPVAKVPSLSPKKLENAEFSPAQPQVSRGPASVSARNSSPSLELIEIENEDEIASIVAAESEHAELPVAPPSTAPNPARVSLRQPSPQPSTAPYRSPGDTISASRAASTAPSTAPLYPPQAMPVSRRPKRRGLVATLVSLLVVAVLVSSYVTRQPSALYAFLRAQGWEQGLDRVIQPLVLKVKNVIHR